MSIRSRLETLDLVRQNPDISVLIIGAGVNGIGTFRDLALQGMDVLIVDKGDYCSGTSAASSHMVHGGLRYLENGEFRLVREAVKERNLLLKNAPHYVKPLPTTIPIFKWFSGIFNAPLKFLGLLDRPAERGLLVIKIGLIIYDMYTKVHQVMPNHSMDWRRASLKKFPSLNPNILCTATYFDGKMASPERICIDLLHDAQKASAKALALNYVSAVRAVEDSVTLRDECTGQTFKVRPQVVVNAAGPWIDIVNHGLGQETQYIGGTKGSHLVLNHPQLREIIGEHEFFFENRDGRIVEIFPLEDRVQIGTSDIPIDDPDQARCTDDEMDYFFNMIEIVFPDVEVNRSHIVFTFSGVRPLTGSNVKTTGQISRDHSIEILEPDDSLAFPAYSLVGGKWTSFRAFSEEVADTVLKRLGRVRKQSTELLPIGGGRDYPTSTEGQHEWIAGTAEKLGLPEDRVSILFKRYGMHAREILEFIMQGTDRPLTNHPGYSHREVAYLACHEQVTHLDDLLLRRSLLGMLGNVTLDLITEMAETVGEALGWSKDQREIEITRTRALFADRHRISL